MMALDMDKLRKVKALMDGGKTAGERAAARAKAVRAMLATSPRLSDREIARRVGCSPQTVGNWRRRLAA